MLSSRGTGTVEGFERFNDEGFPAPLGQEDDGNNRVQVALDDPTDWHAMAGRGMLFYPTLHDLWRMSWRKHRSHGYMLLVEAEMEMLMVVGKIPNDGLAQESGEVSVLTRVSYALDFHIHPHFELVEEAQVPAHIHTAFFATMGRPQ